MDSIEDLIIDYEDNMLINEPCIIRGMPDNIYHTAKGLSRSGLKLLLDCPAKYYYKYLSGEYEPKEKPSFKIGKAAHKYILEGKEAFEQTYWHNPYAELKKAEIELLLKEKYNCVEKGLLIDQMQRLLDYEGIEQKEIELSKSELNMVVGLARSIRLNPEAYAAFKQQGESELSIFWIDDKTGLWLKCRPDFLPYDCRLVPDYKTTSSAKPENLWTSFIDYGYHIQAAMYRQGIETVTGLDVENFFFVMQEKEPPFVSQIFEPDEMMLDIGEKQMRYAIDRYVECKEKGLWTAYSDKIVQLSLAPRPEDLSTNFDAENGTAYAPAWVDAALLKYDYLGA
ncbi:MAG: PD-(D/E)XK nuclease-like domain-containing protein [Bacteroidales bacterium]|nr:PD-(D/E)XK nuclease-like domain-containing protein [Bacteroidales bacterium]